jgi:hypothetical protein
LELEMEMLVVRTKVELAWGMLVVGTKVGLAWGMLVVRTLGRFTRTYSRPATNLVGHWWASNK